MSTWRILRRHTARKTHRCVMGDVIEPGDQYTYEAVAPWAPTQEDPDSPTHPLGEWVSVRYHDGCGPVDSPYWL